MSALGKRLIASAEEGIAMVARERLRDHAPEEPAKVAPPKRTRRGPRPAYSYRARRRNVCIRFAGYKWADFQKVRPYTWRAP